MPYSPSGQPYAQPADLATFGLSQQALSHPSIGLSVQQQHLLAASQEVDSYLRNRCVLPLQRWGADIIKAVCGLAAATLVSVRGFDPTTDGVWLAREKVARDWLTDIREGKAFPDVQDSSGAAQGLAAPISTPQLSTPTVINLAGTSQRGT